MTIASGKTCCGSEIENCGLRFGAPKVVADPVVMPCLHGLAQQSGAFLGYPDALDRAIFESSLLDVILYDSVNRINAVRIPDLGLEQLFSVDFLKFFLPLVGVTFAWFWNERRKRLADEYVRKEKKYEALIDSLQGFYASDRTPSRSRAEGALSTRVFSDASVCWP